MRYVQDPQWGEVYVDDASGTIYRPYSDEGGTTLGFLGNYNSDVGFDSFKPVSTPVPAPAPAPAADPFASIPKPEWVSSSDPYWSQFGNVAGRDPESGEFTNPYISTIRGLEDVGNWRSVAGQLGYQGPFETQVISSDPAEGGGGYATVTAPEFQQFIEQKKAEGYDFVVKGDEVDKSTSTFGLKTPSGEVVAQRKAKAAGFGEFFKEFLLPAAGIALGMGGFNSLMGGAAAPTSAASGAGLGAMEGVGLTGNIVNAATGQTIAALPTAGVTVADLANIPSDVLGQLSPATEVLDLAPIENTVTSVYAPGVEPVFPESVFDMPIAGPASSPTVFPESVFDMPIARAASAAPAPSSAPIFDLGGNAIDPFTSEILSPASVEPAAASAVGSANVSRGLLYGKEAYGPGMTGAQTAAYDSILGLTGSKTLADLAGTATGLTTNTTDLKDLAKSAIGIGKDVLSSRAGLAGLGALLSYFDKQPPRGGGYTGVAAAPTPMTRTMVRGAYGPIAQYAANGGLMQAYAQGGVTGTHRRPMQMEDGGFVMTKRAVDGAGGPRGIAQMLPGARPIVGPGTGTSDSIPATIAGRTPARVSNGEAYVPKAVVNRAGGAQALYALMNKLQRRA